MAKVQDLYISYVLVKKLQTPFNKMPAFEMGLIDDKGVFQKPRSSWSPQEKKEVSKLDTVVINIKRLAGRFLPGKLATTAAALYLLKESDLPEDSEELIQESLKLMGLLLLEEEGQVDSSSPTNSVGTGKVDLSPIVKQDKHSITLKANRQTYDKCFRGKCKKERFDSYIEEESLLTVVRDYSKKYPNNSIILQNEESGSRVFLKYGKHGSYGIRPRG